VRCGCSADRFGSGGPVCCPQPYGVEEEHFKYSVFLVLNNRLVSMSIAACVLAWKRLGVAPVAPLPAYAAVSLSNVIATTCQYEALRFVSFAGVTLAKSAKMLPVLLWVRAAAPLTRGAR
jgi:adenosine 3'-phospho 5'-phosphosulfate transporter B2